MKNTEHSKKSIKKAVAIGYEPTKNNAPKVLAGGRGELADRIIAAAKKNNIPLYEDKELVDTLLCLDIDDEIPEKLYKVIAEVLVFVYSLDKEAADVKTT